MELDHVMIPLADLSKAVTGFERRYGLVSVEGGRHADWGTANRIVPLGDSYLELVAVVDPAEASQSAFGRWVANARAGQPLGWAVRTDDLAAVAGRLGLNIGSGSRFTATGELLRWQIAGLSARWPSPGCPSSSSGLSRVGSRSDRRGAPSGCDRHKTADRRGRTETALLLVGWAPVAADPG